jgi:hypothetical protein
MSAAEALQAARKVRIGLFVDGGELVLKASAPPPADVLDLLSRHKVDVIAMLRRGGDGWLAEDWLAFYDERAGIAEFDGGLPRTEAEARAFACCIAEWLNRNPVRSPPGHCLGCGGPKQPHEPLLPFETETTGHAWLHHRCWSACHAGRTADAAAALAAMGIQERSIHP